MKVMKFEKDDYNGDEYEKDNGDDCFDDDDYFDDNDDDNDGGGDDNDDENCRLHFIPSMKLKSCLLIIKLFCMSRTSSNSSRSDSIR